MGSRLRKMRGGFRVVAALCGTVGAVRVVPQGDSVPIQMWGMNTTSDMKLWNMNITSGSSGLMLNDLEGMGLEATNQFENPLKDQLLKIFQQLDTFLVSKGTTPLLMEG